MPTRNNDYKEKKRKEKKRKEKKRRGLGSNFRVAVQYLFYIFTVTYYSHFHPRVPYRSSKKKKKRKKERNSWCGYETNALYIKTHLLNVKFCLCNGCWCQFQIYI